MRDHDEAAQAEEVGAAVRLGVEPRPDAPRRGADEEPAELPAHDASSSERSEPRIVRIVPSSAFSATLPGEAVGDDDVGRPSSSHLLSVFPANRSRSPRRSSWASRASWFPSPPPRRSRGADLRLGDAQDLLREDRAHVRELDEVLGPGVGVRAGVDEDARAAAGRQHDRDPGRRTPGSRRRWRSDAASIAPGAPGGDDGLRVAVGDGAHGADERRARLRPHGLDRRLVHLDRLIGLDERQAVGVEPGPAVEDRLEVGARRGEAPATISSGPRSPPRASTATRTAMRGAATGAWTRSGSTSRPRYVLQFGQTWCARFGCRQFGQTWTRGASRACCARRLSRLARDVLLLGTAMSGCGV